MNLLMDVYVCLYNYQEMCLEEEGRHGEGEGLWMK